MPEEFFMIQVGAPKDFIGKTLIELNLRARYSVHVVAIKELVPENYILVPPADYVIKDSAILVMLGRSTDIRRIKELK
jgi:trk system potassium uptake protein TrkA